MSRVDPPIPTLAAAVPEIAAPKRVQEARTGETRTGKSLRPRHEAFCQHFVLLGNAADAAARAGYAAEWARNQGYRLMCQPRIQARVAKIQSGLSSVYCLDAGVLLGKLEAVYQRAVGNLDFHAAARCVEIQARIAGHVAGSKHQRGVDGRSPDRDIDKTTNDDFSAPIADANRSGSTA